MKINTMIIVKIHLKHSKILLLLIPTKSMGCQSLMIQKRRLIEVAVIDPQPIFLSISYISNWISIDIMINTVYIYGLSSPTPLFLEKVRISEVISKN